MEELVILYTTWPDADTAEAVGRAAVETMLAACANVLGPMRSIYRWDGAVQSEAETPMLLKTTAAAAPSLTAFLLERHPYETPCIVALDALKEGSNPAFADWVVRQIN